MLAWRLLVEVLDLGVLLSQFVVPTGLEQAVAERLGATRQRAVALAWEGRLRARRLRIEDGDDFQGGTAMVP